MRNQHFTRHKTRQLGIYSAFLFYSDFYCKTMSKIRSQVLILKSVIFSKNILKKMNKIKLSRTTWMLLGESIAKHDQNHKQIRWDYHYLSFLYCSEIFSWLSFKLVVVFVNHQQQSKKWKITSVSSQYKYSSFGKFSDASW